MAFCKKCGSNVPAGKKFCPKCGSKIEIQGRSDSVAPSAFGVSGGTNSAIPPAFGVPGGANNAVPPVSGAATGFQSAQSKPAQQAGVRTGQSHASRNLLPICLIVAGAAVLILAIVLIVRAVRSGEEDSVEPEPEKYSILGEWLSDDAVNLNKTLENWMVDAGLSESLAAMVTNITGMAMDNVTVYFDEKGTMDISVGGVSLGILEFTYEELGNNRMKLSWEIPVDLRAVGVEVDLQNISYRAKYSVSADKLTLDLFGTEVEFTRQE